MKLHCLWITLLLCVPAQAEQKLSFDGYELHYSVIPTQFLDAGIAKQYNIVRGKGRALVNLSLLKDGTGIVAEAISGSVKNLLSQKQELVFAKITEGQAVYYLAELRHADEDTLNFELQVTAPGLTERTLKFQQKLYTDGVQLSADD